MIRLNTLGPMEFRREGGDDLRAVLVQPKRLGLLVYLAVEAPDRFVRRDALLSLFWPELDQTQARQALRSALYFLRQHLGDGVLTGRGADEVGVASAALATDVVAFREAAERGDAAAALALYRGDFLTGLHVADGSTELDQWAGRTRLELKRQAAALAWSLAERAEEARNPAGAAQWGRRAFEVDAADEASLRRLMELLARLGDTGGALRVYEEFAARLRADLGVSPSPESRALVKQLRIRRPTPGPRAALDLDPERARAAAQLARASGAQRSVEPRPQSGRAPAPPVSVWRRPAVVTAAAVALALAAFAVRESVDRPGDGVAAGIEGPVAVAALRNETGDSALAIWGRYAGDWITQGLQAVGRVPVVPWPSALRASELADSAVRAGSADPVAIMRRETGAGTVITGSYYRVNDSIQFRADISSARGPRLLWSVPSIAAVPDSIEVAIRELRDRLLGGIGISTGPEFADNPRLGPNPPRFAAFAAYERGVSLFDASRYEEAAAEYERAFGLDSSFVTPALSALAAYSNTRRYGRVDTLVRLLARRRTTLTEPQDLELRGVEALMRGDGRTSLEVRRRTAAVAPSPSSSYRVASLALTMGRPREALAALEPHRGNETYVSRWALYLIYLAHSYHLTGRYQEALGAVRELKRRFPERSVAMALEVASLAALGRTDAIDSIFAADVSAPNTYWSTGGALMIAGQELVVHGHRAKADEYYERSLAWLQERLRSDPDNPSHHEWQAAVLYQLGRWDEAQRLAEELAVLQPDRLLFRLIPALVDARRGDTARAVRRLGEPDVRDRGWHLAAQARIAAIAGDAPRAVALLTEALDRGVPSFHWAHSDWWLDFSAVADDPQIRRLMLEGIG